MTRCGSWPTPTGRADPVPVHGSPPPVHPATAGPTGRPGAAGARRAAAGKGGPRYGTGRRAERLAPYVLLAPAILIILALRLFPLLLGVNFSFTGDGEHDGQPVGLDNYAELLRDPLFRAALENVGLLVLLLPVAVAIPGLLATFIHLRVPGHRFYRGVYFFPAVLSPVIVGAIFNLLLAFDGPLNSGLGHLGIGPVDWLGDPDIAMFTVVGVHIWATFGMALVVFLAGFSTLDPSLQDAARVDGASLPQLIRHVIVPGLSRTLQFVVVTTMIGMLTSMFGLLYVMTSGGPEGSTYLPEYYVWIQQGQLNRPALASAASTVLFVIMLVVGLAQIALLRRSGRES
ncbi:sugar ABC transporter permease [Streptomyces sp. XC 2026]|nr:sugar ABC transporter permease [Streptomyces sp. XC 2026]